MRNTLKKISPLSTRPVARAASAAIENLESRQLMTATFKIGIGVNDGSSAFMNAATPKLQSLGVQTVRLYASVDLNSRSWSGVFQRAVDYKARGFDVMLEVTPNNGTVPSSDSEVQGWFNWALGTALKGAVNRWEIGNEVDHSNYWNGSLSQYVNQYLKPAYQTLHSAGEEVVSAGPSWNPQDVQTMINDGMLNYCDYVGYHPYATGVAMVEQRLTEIKDVVAGRKPLVASEWNVRGLESNPTAWAAADAQVYSDIASTFAINYYYAAEKVNTMAGPAGIMYSNGSANQPFYNAFASFRSGGTDPVSTPTPPVVTPPVVTPPSTGNTAAGSYGSISGTLFNDTDGNGKMDNGDVNSGVRTVFLDTNQNGILDAGEKSVVQSASNGTFKFSGLSAGKYYVTRVFPAGYHLSNTTAKDIVVTLSPGQIVSGINLGTTNKIVSNTPVTTPVTSPVVTTPAPVTSSSAASVYSFNFINAAGAVIPGLSYISGDMTIKLSSLPTRNISLAAIVSAGVKSVKYNVLGTTLTDSSAPYSMLGQTGSTFKTFYAQAGKYTFTATGYTAANAAGTTAGSKSITVTFI